MGEKSKMTPAQKPPSENQIGYSIKFDLIDWIDLDNQIFIHAWPFTQVDWLTISICLNIKAVGNHTALVLIGFLGPPGTPWPPILCLNRGR